MRARCQSAAPIDDHAVFDAGQQEERRRPDDVLGRQRRAAELESEQEAEQVVGRVGAAAIDVLAEVGVDLQEGPSADLRIGRSDLEQLVQPEPELIAVLLGQAEHASDDEDRDVLGVGRGGVELGDVPDPVERVATDLAGDRLPSIDLARGEGGKEHSPGHGMLRWVACDRRGDAGEILGRRLVDQDGARREVLRVIRDGGDLVVASDEVRPVEAVRVRDRASRAQVIPDLVGADTPLRVEMIEVGRPVVDLRAGVGHQAPSGLRTRSPVRQ